jgi:hypothetical protein
MPDFDPSPDASGPPIAGRSSAAAHGPNPASAEPGPGPLVEGRDFYLERGLMVLTADFLRRRGYCCGNGCRHCPWEKGS